LICGQGQYAEHEMSHHLATGAHAHESASKLIFQAGVDTLDGGALAKTNSLMGSQRQFVLVEAPQRIDDRYVTQPLVPAGWATWRSCKEAAVSTARIGMWASATSQCSL
jgi:hypothetical protein